MKKLSYSTVFALIIIMAYGAVCMAQADVEKETPVYEKRFAAGEKTGFIGIFTHTPTAFSMDVKIEETSRFLASNPYLSGVTIKMTWRQFHPAKDTIYWNKLETLIDIIAAHGKLINFVIVAGYRTPGWVYDEGVEKIEVEGPRNGTAPLPWDPMYMRLFTADLRAIAERYADDPRIFMFGVNGHNFRGEEMHAPSSSLFPDFSCEKVMENWKYWIDLHAELFPQKWLSLVISQMYKTYRDLPDKVVAYFMDKCQGRAVLQTDQLNGREDAMPQSARLCQKYARLGPHCHEMVGSFKEQPERQGTAEMTVYNFVKLGNPLYLQLWARDSYDPQYAKALLYAWEKYGHMAPDELKTHLKKEGKYIETSTWKRGR